jgi:hypothetical protein
VFKAQKEAFMSTNSEKSKEMGVFERITGVFISPKETFEAIDQKPTWLVPFIIIVVMTLGMAVLTRDIGMQDMMAKYQAMELPQEQIDKIAAQSQGIGKYIQMVLIPVATLAIWAIFAGILLFCGNTLLGGSAKFKKLFSMISWSSFVGALAIIVNTAIILSKGTTQGVTTSLAVLMPVPGLSDKPSLLYRLLSKFDVFTIWSLILWTIGLSVIYKFTMKKSAGLVIALWAVWIVISIAFGSLFGAMFGQ